MNEQDEVLLRDMLDAAEAVQSFVNEGNRERLDRDRMYAFAMARGIEIIGEAASHVSSETRSRHTQMDWKNIIGMRNRIVHGYMNIDHDIVWFVASQEVPALIRQLIDILPADNPGER